MDIELKESESEMNTGSGPLNTFNELVDEENKFYCEKCYDMVNYFISECLTMSPQLSELKVNCKKLSKFKSSMINKYETLEFNYEEVKAQKEDYEERYNFLLNKLSSKYGTKPVEVEEKALAKRPVQSNVIHINDLDADLCNFHIQTNINDHFFIDLDILKKQITTETKINFELTFKHFAQKADEYRKINSNKLLAFKKKLTSQNVLPSHSNNSSELRSKLEKENALKDSQLKVLTDENEQLKNANKRLSEELESFRQENDLLKTSYDKTNVSLQDWKLKCDQTENQVTELEKLNDELMQDLKNYTEKKSK